MVMMPNEMALDDGAGNDQLLDDVGTGYIQEMKSLFDKYGSSGLCMYVCMHILYVSDTLMLGSDMWFWRVFLSYVCYELQEIYWRWI